VSVRLVTRSAFSIPSQRPRSEPVRSEAGGQDVSPGKHAAPSSQVGKEPARDDDLRFAECRGSDRNYAEHPRPGWTIPPWDRALLPDEPGAAQVVTQTDSEAAERFQTAFATLEE